MHNSLSELSADPISRQIIIAKYIEQVSGDDQNLEHSLKTRFSDDKYFSKMSLKCVDEAIALSTLVFALKEDSNFTEMLSDIEPIDEEFLHEMRKSIFIDSVEILTETAVKTEAEIININRRSKEVMLIFTPV